MRGSFFLKEQKNLPTKKNLSSLWKITRRVKIVPVVMRGRHRCGGEMRTEEHKERSNFNKNINSKIMDFEKPPMPKLEEGNDDNNSREVYEKAQKKVHIEQVGLESEEKRRTQRIAEFKKDVKENPMSLLTIIDILPTNLDVLLAKRRLHSAEKKLSELNKEAHAEANELNQKYEGLKDEVLKAGENLKEALQKLSDFETSSLGMENKSSESPETEKIE